MKPRRLLTALLALALIVAAPFNKARAAYDMPYYIVVDISNQVVTVYDTATNDIVRQMLCSTGRNNYTPTGNFILPKNAQRYDRQPWYYIAMFRRYVKYATRIKGEILFHSLPYTRKSLQSIDTQAAAELGTPASHGCIRLRWQDARFIAENCLAGTAVKITQSDSRDDGLRELLFQQSFDASDGLSYDSFLGISRQEGELGRFSEGDEVLNLQYRLRDLGLYDGELSGVYDSATVNAVRSAQYLMGQDLSGVASPGFQREIYASDAPTAMEVRLSEGMSGPAVRVLQDNLAALRLYGDAPDSVYDRAVVEAVQRFQRAYGYEADGVAAPKVQKAAAYEARRLAETFGGGDYALEEVVEPLPVARVSARGGARLRRGASQKSEVVRSLAQGQGMIVLEKGGGWCRMRCGGDSGYVKSSLLELGRLDIATLRYTAGEDDLICAVGGGAADYAAGARLPCEVFDEYLAANDRGRDIDSLASYVTVETGEGGASLNLRATPRADGEVLDAVPNGERLRVQRRASEWTQVSYRGQAGYLMNRYLSFWTGPKDALDDSLDADAEAAATSGYAVVHSASGEKAAVYAADADDAKLLGRLPDGLRLEVLEMVDGWCRVRYEGREGYMIGEDLQIEPAPEAEPAQEPEAGPTEDALLVEELRP